MPCDSKIMLLGSCFSNEIGRLLAEDNFDVCINPFGTLFNPVSIANSIERLNNNVPFSSNEVIECIYGRNNGIPVKKYGSFSHYTLFSKETPEEFLNFANNKLKKDSLFFKQADIIIITLGTAWTFRELEHNIIVSNCHKLPANRFKKELLSHSQCVETLKNIIYNKEGSFKYPDKKFIFTVSPIRHLSNGAHSNNISKATLLLSIDDLIGSCLNSTLSYFPAYEIMIDELRDYKYYSKDLVHPSEEAIGIIYKRFKDELSRL